MKTRTFKDRETTMALIAFIDPYIVTLLKKYNGYVCGGAITSAFTRKPINDIDIYFKTVDNHAGFMTELNPGHEYKNDFAFSKSAKMKKEANKKPQIVFETDNAISMWFRDKKYQVITAFRGEPAVVFDFYDFTINMCAWDPSTEELTVFELFADHLAKRKLIINVGTEYPLSTVIRTYKYVKRGYTITGMEMVKILLKVHSLKLNNFSELKKQLMGIDTLFLKPLTDYLNQGEHAQAEYDFGKFMELWNKLIEENYDEDVTHDYTDPTE